jgi:hypothetical protein
MILAATCSENVTPSDAAVLCTVIICTTVLLIWMFK